MKGGTEEAAWDAGHVAAVEGQGGGGARSGLETKLSVSWEIEVGGLNPPLVGKGLN